MGFLGIIYILALGPPLLQGEKLLIFGHYFNNLMLILKRTTVIMLLVIRFFVFLLFEYKFRKHFTLPLGVRGPLVK